MSKRSLFWANASGKLGEAVFYRSGGEQRTRTYVAKIKNPKTLAQVKNRLMMGNLVSSFRNLKQVLQVSFPNRKTNQSGFNAFVSANKNIECAVINKSDLENGLCCPADMYVSKGSLLNLGTPVVKTLMDTTAVVVDVTTQFDTTKWDGSIGGFSGQNAGSPEKLKALFGCLGLSDNAKITIVKGVYADTGYRMQTVSLGVDSPAVDFLKLGVVTFGYTSSEDSQNLWLGVQFGTGVSDELLSFFISDRNADGKLQVSTAKMLYTEDGKEYIDQFFPGGLLYENALAEMGYNSDSVL